MSEIESNSESEIENNSDSSESDFNPIFKKDSRNEKLKKNFNDNSSIINKICNSESKTQCIIYNQLTKPQLLMIINFINSLRKKNGILPKKMQSKKTLKYFDKHSSIINLNYNRNSKKQQVNFLLFINFFSVLNIAFSAYRSPL